MTTGVVDLYIDSWRDAAACSAGPHVDFFPDPADLGAISAAKAMCSTCPVAGECLTWAVGTNQSEGIWGGHTPAERRSLRRHWLKEVRRAS